MFFQELKPGLPNIAHWIVAGIPMGNKHRKNTKECAVIDVAGKLEVNIAGKYINGISWGCQSIQVQNGWNNSH